jgi:hypothetical protein
MKTASQTPSGVGISTLVSITGKVSDMELLSHKP